MMLSVTEAAKAAGCARSTIYDKIKSGELSRTSEGIDTAELLRVFGELKNHNDKQEAPAVAAQPVADDMALWFRDQLEETQQELKQSQAELADTQERLTEHREAARSLMSPEQFEDQLQAAVLVEREKADVAMDAEKAKAEAKSQEWKQALSARQAEIQQAKDDAADLAERLQSEQAERAKAERQAKALANRGVLARLFNLKPGSAT